MVMPRNGLTALRRGRAPDSSTAPRAWSPPGSSVVALASGMSRPLIKTTRLRKASSGLVMKENSKSLPDLSGLQYPGAAPCGCQMPTNRFTGAAAVSRDGVNAGSIESSNGSASVTPAPRRNVRRGMCFLATNIVVSTHSRRVHRTGPGLQLSVRVYNVLALDPHLELRALHYCQHDGRESVVVLGHVARNRPNRRHVGVLHAPSHRIGHQLLDEHPDKLR